jgi:hypothetical protein
MKYQGKAGSGKNRSFNHTIFIRKYLQKILKMPTERLGFVTSRNYRIKGLEYKQKRVKSKLIKIRKYIARLSICNCSKLIHDNTHVG